MIQSRPSVSPCTVSSISEHTPLLQNSDEASILSSSSSTTTSSCSNTSSASIDDCQSDTEAQADIDDQNSTNIFGTILVLLIGVFLSSADASVVLANHAAIASELGSFDDSSWLITSFLVGVCATQPLYGKLSDIFGRKCMLLIAYGFLTTGCFICAVSNSIQAVILGRFITGIGAAGVVCLVSIIITDLVVLREVAQWRSYSYATANIGRAIGAPLGGFLNDTIGWRWSFAGQCPIAIFAMLMIWWTFKIDEKQKQKQRVYSKQELLQRVDLLGSVFIVTTIICFLMILDFGGKKLAWNDPNMLILMLCCIASATIFCYVELYRAQEPIFPLGLLMNRNVVASYVVIFCETGGLISVLSNVALYFRITQDASNLNAALHILPSTTGNCLGALFTGMIIKRTGRYKAMAIFSTISLMLAFSLICFLWQGHTNIWQTLFLFPGGLGCGISTASVFIALTANIPSEHLAVAASGYYLMDNLGYVTAIAVPDLVIKSVTKAKLAVSLGSLPEHNQIISRILKDYTIISTLPSHLKALVVQAYVQGIRSGFFVALGFSIIAFLTSFMLTEKRLDMKRPIKP